MKRMLFLFLLLFTAATLPAQNISYRYDAAGNRTERIISPRPKPGISPGPAMSILKDPIAEYGLKIYPNSSKESLSVEIGNYSADIQAELWLFDPSGRLLARKKASSREVHFDLSGYQKGIYILRLDLNGETVTWKVAKE